VVERAKGAELDVAAATAELRAAVSATHGLRLHDVVFLRPGEVPRTSSGKISRTLCRRSYSDGALAGRRLR
jgi:acyl-CoA synthetase (AMP-forming)/AMP-acid ligase II